jgi:hypothetical protein
MNYFVVWPLQNRNVLSLSEGVPEHCTKDSHKLWSIRIVFLGILDFSNNEGSSSVGVGSSYIGEGN